jgi:glycosyltransferase involved in cell wall biosynthesis
MKVLMYAIFPSDSCSPPKGGAETATYNLLCGFKELDVNILVVSFNKDLNKSKEISFSENIRVLLFPYKYKHSTILEILLHSKKILKSLHRKYKPDIVHIQGNGSKFFTRKVFMTTPVIATLHAILINEYKSINRKVERLNYKIMMHAEKANIKLLKGFIYIADYYKDYFETHYKGLNNSSQKIYNAVHPDFYKRLDEKVDEAGLVYVGVINARKNLLCLLEALDRIKKEKIAFTLHIVGGFGEESYKRKIEDFIAQNNLKENIIFHGWKSQQEVKDILEQNSVFVLPSKAEGLPISIGESMAMGKIVVSSNVGGISEIIQSNVNGYLFEVDDTEELSGILRKVLTSKKTEMSKKARQSALENHSPREVAEKTLAFYKDVLNVN